MKRIPHVSAVLFLHIWKMSSFQQMKRALKTNEGRGMNENLSFSS